MARGEPVEPEGLVYRPDFVTSAEEQALVRAIEASPFGEVRMHGVTAKRGVQHYGWSYGYESWRIAPTAPVPAFLHELRERCAALAEVPAASLEQVLIAKYPPGAGIGWHRDAPMFGPRVVGVSLLGACRMRFRRTVEGRTLTWALELEPRSAYVLAGPARSAWQHHIPPVKELRYSISFRTVPKPEEYLANVDDAREGQR